MGRERHEAEAAVGVRIPADYRHLTMLRGITETALLLAEFALDEVTDLQVAIDEVVTGLVDAAIDGSTIACDLTVDRGRVAVCVSGTAGTRDVIDRNGLGWHVIRTITGTPIANIGGYDVMSGGYPVSVEFVRDTGVSL
ncbi:anti-sigma factor [Nocardia nova]|uniref:anti-sigma factor n=1 Tax=Nocardia nova TaxID=37330 RepID=UPI0033E79593